MASKACGLSFFGDGTRSLAGDRAWEKRHDQHAKWSSAAVVFIGSDNARGDGLDKLGRGSRACGVFECRSSSMAEVIQAVLHAVGGLVGIHDLECRWRGAVVRISVDAYGPCEVCGAKHRVGVFRPSELWFGAIRRLHDGMWRELLWK